MQLKEYLPLLFLMVLCGQVRASDTIFLKREINTDPISGSYSYHAIFIEKGNSKWYDRIAKFTLTDWDSSMILNPAYHIAGKKLIKHHLLGLPTQWVPLYLYKGKHYVYSPSEGGYEHKLWLTNTIIYEYSMEGFMPSRLSEVRKIDRNNYMIRRRSNWGSEIRIHIIDTLRNIAVVTTYYEDGKPSHQLMVDARNIREFPIVVNYCKQHRTEEFEFDKPDFQNLLRK